LVPAALVGCSGNAGLEMAVVNGDVKYAGKPIEDGLIRFCPIESTRGPANVARIVQGHYEMTARGGVPVGKHRVKITAFKESAAAQPLPEGLPGAEHSVLPKKQFLPPKYNSRSILEAMVPPNPNYSELREFLGLQVHLSG